MQSRIERLSALSVSEEISAFHRAFFSSTLFLIFQSRHVKALESRSQLLDAALASADEANRRWEECRALVDQLRVENAALRAALSQAHLLPPSLNNQQPQPPPTITHNPPQEDPKPADSAAEPQKNDVLEKSTD